MPHTAVTASSHTKPDQASGRPRRVSARSWRGVPLIACHRAAPHRQSERPTEIGIRSLPDRDPKEVISPTSTTATMPAGVRGAEACAPYISILQITVGRATKRRVGLAEHEIGQPALVVGEVGFLDGDFTITNHEDVAEVVRARRRWCDRG